MKIFRDYNFLPDFICIIDVMNNPDTEITISLSPYQIASLEAFIDEQDDNPTHAEAVLQILDDWFVAHRYKALKGD